MQETDNELRAGAYTIVCSNGRWNAITQGNVEFSTMLESRMIAFMKTKAEEWWWNG
jgi:hypothetical protein